MTDTPFSDRLAEIKADPVPFDPVSTGAERVYRRALARGVSHDEAHAASIDWMMRGGSLDAAEAQNERQRLQDEANAAAGEAWAASPEGRISKAEEEYNKKQARRDLRHKAEAMLVAEGRFSARIAAELTDDEILEAAGIEQPVLEGQATRVAAEDARYADPVERPKLLAEKAEHSLRNRYWTMTPEARRAEAIELGYDPEHFHTRMRQLAGMED